MSNKSLIDFPCSFTIKIMGKQQEFFLTTIEAVIKSHIQNVSRDQIKTRASAQGNYLAITAEIYVYNQEQLDGLYRELSSHPMVSMVL